LSCRLCGGSPFAKVVQGEQLLGSTEKKTSAICFLGDGMARKKKKVEHFRSWKKLLEWLWAVLDRVSASRFKWAGLGLKPKRGKQAASKALVKKFSAGLGSVSVASDPDYLEPVSTHA